MQFQPDLKNGKADWKSGWRVLAVAVVMLMVGLPLFAALTGDLQGTIFDPKGALIQDAKITITNEATGVAREVFTSANGDFSAQQLDIGTYKVKVEKTGFRTLSTKAAIRSGEQTRLNLTLELGQLAETVTVEGAVGPELDVSSAQISNSFSEKQVQDLPNFGRDPLAYATLTAGVVPVTKDNPFLGSGSYNSNGQRGRGNNITVDNITSTDISTTGSSETGTFSLDAVQEVKLITNNFSAEFGRNSGSQYQIITKGGTNNYHGTMYWSHQNAALNARDFFDTTGKATPFIQNAWGFVAGGPVIKDHLFAFGHYEGIKNRGAGSSSAASVLKPTDVAGITDPTSLALFNGVGAPTDPSGVLNGAAPNAGNQYAWSVRIDENWRGGKDSISSRYGTNPVSSVSPGLTFIGTNLTNYGANVVDTDRQFSFAYTHSFSPAVINQFRFAFGRSNPSFQPFTTLKAPFTAVINITGFDSMGVSNILPQGRVQNTFQYSDSVSYSAGKHNYKFGFDAIRYQANSFFDANFRGTFAFASLSDFQNGIPQSFTERFGTSVRGNRSTDYFGYAQDDFRATNTLTLNLGVRVESSGGVSEVNGLLANLNRADFSPLGGGGIGPLGSIDLGGEAYRRNTNWAPRFGIAWNPRGGKFVFRGGYGWAYDYIFGNPITNLRFSPPFVPSTTIQAFTGNNTYAQVAAGTSDAQQQAIAAIGHFLPTQVNFGNVSPVDQHLQNPRADQWSLGVEYQLSKDFLVKTSYVGTKGNRLLRSLPINLVKPAVVPAPATDTTDEANRLAAFRGVFVGETGSATGSVVNNRFDPRFNAVTQVQSAGSSIYHSLQVDVIKRLSHGLQFQAAYTYGHSIDDTSDVLGVLVNDSANVQNPRDISNNRGNSQFDLRHRLVLSHLWEIPFAKDTTGFKKKALDGWGFSGVWSIQSGFKSNIFSGSRRGISDILLAGGGVVRADLVGPLSSFHPVPIGSAAAANIPSRCVRGVNTSSNAAVICDDSSGFPFVQPLLGNEGTIGRNAFPLANFQEFDWAFLKDTQLTERFKLQFRLEVFNIFNHTNLSGFQNTLSSGFFGLYTSTASNSRQMQAGLKLNF
ncbi:MAG TPA: carboxypeptidase regulatory-like domain-containing protein [Candidatus Acidoferrum sp.]|nr:carboxypeptidase regulatory-like domain-containing protein [Candidatus Acidoferrum sp.]